MLVGATEGEATPNVPVGPVEEVRSQEDLKSVGKWSEFEK